MSVVAAPRRPIGWVPWLVLAAVLVVSLVIGAAPHRTLTLDQQVRAIATDVRCPSCSALNAADSEAATALAVRSFIRQRLVAGRTPAQVEASLVDRYGGNILLRPPTHGLSATVWALPVVAALAALGGIGWALRRWRANADLEPDSDDRDVVERALRGGS